MAVVAFLILFGVTCYGWGWLTTSLCGRTQKTPGAFNVALGLAVLSLIGGILNVVHLARPAVLHALCAIGATLAMIALGRVVRSHGGIKSCWRVSREKVRAAESDGSLADIIFPWLLVLSFTAFLGWALLPTGAFNAADDFHTYLVRPIRMLATGAVSGNPFDSLGLDGLGGQSFFHSFFLLWLPVTYLNGFDAVFCFALCAAMIVALGRKLELHWGFVMVALLAFASINPQVVNISPVYSGSAMIMGAIMSGWMLAERLQARESNSIWRSALPIALFCGCLIAVKTTLALFAGLYLGVFFLLLGIRVILRRIAFQAALVTGALLLAVILPSLLVIPMTYPPGSDLLTGRLGDLALTAKHASMAARDINNLWSWRELFYGGRVFYYNALVAGIAGVGIAAVCYLRQEGNSPSDKARFSCLASAALAVPAVYLLNVHLFDGSTGVRYSCPVLIAVFPVAAMILQKRVLTSGRKRLDSAVDADNAVFLPAPGRWRFVPLAIQVALVLVFLPTSFSRLDTAMLGRTLLAYPLQQHYLDFNHYCLSKPEANRMRLIQSRTEPGETILAWTALPFYLDFQRNKVLTVTDPGLINPILRFPAGASEANLKEYLRAWGIRYVLFEGDGPYIMSIEELRPLRMARFPVYRKLADYNIYAKASLFRLAEQSQVLFRNEHLILFDLSVPRESEQRLTQRQD